MSISITAQTESVEDVLKTAKKSKFIIPEYQREYTWGINNIDKLFDDLWNFAKSDRSEYFLGTIVTYAHKESNVETQQIVDGQQRLTSLFLLLRAIYKSLEKTEIDEQDSKIKRLKEKISSLIWETDPDTLEIKTKKVSYLLSKVIDDEDGNKILNKILESGEATGNDSYSLNYLRIVELLNGVSSEIDLFPKFVRRVLENVILLPLRTENEDDALCIFHNINTGGLKLSDSDIFKAKIFKYLKKTDELNRTTKLNDFKNTWKSIAKNITYCSASEKFKEIDNLFYYYMFYLRAINKDVETTTPGLMEFYKQKIDNIEFKRLFDKDLMNHIQLILKFKNYWFSGKPVQDWTWSNNKKINKYLDILNDFPNEFGKYPVVVYFLKNYKKDNFEIEFEEFLKNFICKLVPRYLLNSTVNGIKPDVLKLNKSIVNDLTIRFGFDNDEIDLQNLPIKIARPASKSQRMLLKLYAYIYQDELLNKNPKWEIEHILPRSSNENNFEGFARTEIEETKEHLGNKLPLEKKNNIKASNEYLRKKRIECYSKSKIKCVIDFEKTYHNQNNWTPDDIRNRDQIVINEILKNLGFDLNLFKAIADLMPSKNCGSKQEFWKLLNNKIESTNSNLLKIDESDDEALNRNYHNFMKKTDTGIGDFYCRIASKTGGITSFGVYMWPSETKLFNELKSKKEQINKELGFNLLFEPAGQCFRIEYLVEKFNIYIPSSYELLADEIIDKMPKIIKTLISNK